MTLTARADRSVAWQDDPRSLLLVVLLVLLVIWGLTFAAFAGFAPRSLDSVSAWSVLAVCGGVVSYRLIRDPVTLADPLTWFLLASGVYFGFGPLAYHYATPQTIAFMDAFYAVSPDIWLQAQLVSVAGIVVAVAIAFVLWRLIGKYYSLFPVPVAAQTDRSLVLVTIVLLAIGGAVRFGLVVSRGLGILHWTTPDSIEMLSELYKGGLGLAVILALRGQRGWKWGATILAAADIVAGLALLSKLEVLSVIVVMGVAEQLVRPGFVRLVRTGIVMVLVYLAMSPLVGMGRVHGYGALANSTAVKEAVSAISLRGMSDTNIQIWWARLAYTNQQAFAIQSYDEGKPGDTILTTVKIGVIPRFLMPEKPILTTGGRFTELVLGRDIQTATCPTIFAEGYWNAGWPGVIGVALWIGLVVGAFSGFAWWMTASRRYEYFPVLLFGIKMGYRPDDWFVITHVLPVIYVLAVAGCIYLLARFARRYLESPVLLSEVKIKRSG